MEVRLIAPIGGRPLFPVAAYTNYFKDQPQAQYFCIHKTPGYNRRWTLTHVPTGIAFGTKFRTRYTAVKALKEVLSMQRAFAHTGDDFSGPFRGTKWWEGNSKNWYRTIIHINGGI